MARGKINLNWELDGQNLSLPLDLGSHPSKDALSYHYSKFIANI